MSTHANQIHTYRFRPTTIRTPHHILNRKTDERTTRIDKKLMEIDQKDHNPPSSIIKLSKAFEDVHASKSDPDRQVPSHHAYLHGTY